jgi:predicted nuclease of predicted toxin-antitoxin system
MRFLLDENAPLRLIGHLRSLGHDVRSIAQDYQTALDDRVVLQIARRERRILITGDRDFGELIFRQHLPHAGVLYFRLRNTQLPTWIARLEVVLRDYADQLHLYVVVTEGDVRLRTPGGERAR